MPGLAGGVEETLELADLTVAQLGLIIGMVENQALDDVIQRPGGELSGHVRGAFELEWTRSRQLDRPADPIRIIRRLRQSLESITPVEQYAKSSVALRHGDHGAQPQRLEPRDLLPIGADLGGEILELAAMIDSEHHQVFIVPCARGCPVYMLELG